MSRNKINLIATTSLALVFTACGTLQKNQALLEAEQAYTEARQDEKLLRYAPDELDRANQALIRAAESNTEDNMSSLAYVGSTRIKIAKSIAARKAANAKLIELGEIKNQERLRAREIEIQLEQQAKAEALREKEAALAERENALARAESLTQELAELQAMKTERGIVLTLGDVLFSTGKTELLPGAKTTIKKLASFLGEYPAKTVLVEGHTDNVGSDTYNQDLSERRAISVKNALIQAGVDGSRIDTMGLGESQPITDNSTSAGRLKNRRVEIVIRD
jgi:outer membrane protein OmpA-like peptidoglycan-associated protein